MPAPSYTYTLTNGTTADASQVQQNFTDILNGVSDGTKDLSINALTAAGTATFNGNVTLGNASGDDITVTGSLASTIAIKTNNSFNIGSATLGLAGIYLGNGGAGATCRLVSASHATARTYTFPDYGAAANVAMTTSTTSDSNLGTISSVLLTNYYVGTFTANFDTGMKTGTNNITCRYTLVGKQATVEVTGTTVTANATNSDWGTSSGAIPSTLRPQQTSVRVACSTVNNGSSDTTPGRIQFQSDGTITVTRSTTWTSGTATCGFQGCSATWVVA